jgi:hypothetical protein
MSLDRRLDALEARLHPEESPSLVKCLHEARAEAIARRAQGLPAYEPLDEDHPLAERLRQAMERANGLRAWPQENGAPIVTLTDT